MRKSSEAAFDIGHDEEGAANAAASLGPDGGPLKRAKQAYPQSVNASDDDAWLDDELSDEELAALGEEDFDDETLLAEELGVDDTEDFSFDPNETKADLRLAPAAAAEPPLAAPKASRPVTAVAVSRRITDP